MGGWVGGWAARAQGGARQVRVQAGERGRASHGVSLPGPPHAAGAACLREAAHSEEAVHGAAALVPVHCIMRRGGGSVGCTPAM